MEWYLSVWKKFAVFEGRARRKEFWTFILINLIVETVLVTVDEFLGIDLLSTIYGLGVLIPMLAVSVRRLHDTNRSGWWLLVPLVPLVFLCQDGDPTDNRYGPNPKTTVAQV